MRWSACCFYLRECSSCLFYSEAVGGSCREKPWSNPARAIRERLIRLQGEELACPAEDDEQVDEPVDEFVDEPVEKSVELQEEEQPEQELHAAEVMLGRVQSWTSEQRSDVASPS